MPQNQFVWSGSKGLKGMIPFVKSLQLGVRGKPEEVGH